MAGARASFEALRRRAGGQSKVAAAAAGSSPMKQRGSRIEAERVSDFWRTRTVQVLSQVQVILHVRDRSGLAEGAVHAAAVDLRPENRSGKRSYGRRGEGKGGVEGEM